MEYTDQRSINLATKPIGRLLLQFATPSLIAMSANSIYNLCDSIFIGQGVGPLAIAGMAITFPIMSISSAFGAMLGVGSASQTSIAMGSKDQKRGLHIFGNMLCLDVLISLILTIVGLTFINPILRLFGASDTVLPYAREYIQVILAGNIITHLFLGLCDQLRASGNPRLSMRSHLIVVICNIILDPIFIYTLNLGIRGAALATIISQFLGLLFASRFFFDKSRFIHFTRKAFSLNAKIIHDIITIGLSPFLVNVCGCVIIILINRTLTYYGADDGDTCIGAYGIANRMNALMVMMVSGFSQGMQPIVGFNIGARNMVRVLNTVRITYMCATSIMVLGFVLIYAFPDRVANWFTTNGDLIFTCKHVFRVMLAALPLVGGQIITTTFFQSIRKPKMSIFLSMTRQLLVLMPLLLILPHFMGVDGVWLAIPVSEGVSAFLAMFLLYREVQHVLSTY